jgi:hypothetical protein
MVGNLGICGGSTLTTLQQSILQAADIMDDGSYQPATTCNGISIGIGFDADQIGLPQVVGTPATAVNPCVDAGTGDAGPADAGPG